MSGSPLSISGMVCFVRQNIVFSDPSLFCSLERISRSRLGAVSDTQEYLLKSAMLLRDGDRKVNAGVLHAHAVMDILCVVSLHWGNLVLI